MANGQEMKVVVTGSLQELDEFCDSYFANDTDVENYWKEEHIPLNED